MLLAVDPGKGSVPSIGWALLHNETGDLIDMGQDKFGDFVARLERLEGVSHVVWEEYRVFAKRAKQHSGSKVETIQTIGAIKAWATRKGVTFSEQRADILPSAQNLFQIRMPADHRQSHCISALLHGMFYLYSKGIIQSALEKEIAAKAG